MNPSIDPDLIPSDVAVLKNLLRDNDVKQPSKENGTPLNGEAIGSRIDDHGDAATTAYLDKLRHEPTVITSRDYGTLNLADGPFAPLLSRYIAWASKVARDPVDVVFVTHIILYLCTSVPSALYLYYSFSYVHAVLHFVMQLSYCGSFTLMLHNHIHNNGVLARSYGWLDTAWPVILEPLMGHTWHSYYYHHVKHHHVEGNGPEDLSSTIRYQRDEITEFLKYLGRFMFLIWYDLPRYFIQKGKYTYAFKAGTMELLSYASIVMLASWRFKPTLWVFIIPLVQMRIGLMVGNFGQHALVDDEDPASDFRSSITLIDVNSNRHCFNDGWHTSHHLNPLRHWRDHPRAFMKAKEQYTTNDALVFQNIDYLKMTYHILRKNYDHLADCLVPLGDQRRLSKKEIADMLRHRTKKFSEEEINQKFYQKRA